MAGSRKTGIRRSIERLLNPSSSREGRAAIARLPMIERYFQPGTCTLAIKKFPPRIFDDLAYWALCAIAIIGPLWAALWSIGWVLRR